MMRDASGLEVMYMSLSRRLFCPARIMGRTGFESISNCPRVWSWAKTSMRRRLASSMMRTGTCLLFAISATVSRIVCMSLVKDVELQLMSRAIHICLKTSMTLPVDAMTGITWYWEGWSPPDA